MQEIQIIHENDQNNIHGNYLLYNINNNIYNKKIYSDFYKLGII